MDERAKGAAAAVAIRQIFTPAARSAELNRRRLNRGVTDATTAAVPAVARKCAEFIGEMNLHADTAKFSRKIANHFTGIGSIAIDINEQRWRFVRINAHGCAEYFQLLHPIGSHFPLHGHDGANCGLRIVERRARERGD